VKSEFENQISSQFIKIVKNLKATYAQSMFLHVETFKKRSSILCS